MNKQLMTHLYYGDPSEEFSLYLSKTLAENGADILEIGVPYSDPVCEGQVFQRACLRALQRGMTPFKVLEGIEKIRSSGIRNPIYVTSYFGPIFKFGLEAFVKKVKDVGAQGLIIPDILLEEQGELLQIGKEFGVSIIEFATPYSTEDRLSQIIQASNDFIYCVSVPGVTGVRNQVTSETLDLIHRVKKMTDMPVYIGFGISTPVQVKKVVRAGTDGVIVGSAIGKIYEKFLRDPSKGLREIAIFTKALKASTIQGGDI